MIRLHAKQSIAFSASLRADEWVECEGKTWYPSFRTRALAADDMTESGDRGFSVTAEDVFDADVVGPITAGADAMSAAITRVYDAAAGASCRTDREAPERAANGDAGSPHGALGGHVRSCRAGGRGGPLGT